jgi:NTE family protein
MYSLRRILFLSALLLGLFLLLVPTGHILAAETPTQEEDADRPKIGLVLGGGGARGGAHIGVLKVLEEMNVPIDYVVGTSMGSIVGSLFAIGLNPEEIEASVVSVDWDDLFIDRPERTQRIYRRKQDDSAAFIQVEWGWKNGLVLASGVVAGQKLSFAFRDPALYLSGHDGFNELPYPFRAVTTDLQTGAMYVPEKGNLLKAVRASMSIPGIFPPVPWDDRVLVDGYLARNLPVDVCRAMGADIIIAVDVGALPEHTDPESLKTLMGINAQKSNIGARQNVDPQVADADIIIQPPLGGFSSQNFNQVSSTIEPGRRGAEAVADQLRKYSLSAEAYADHLAAHAPRKLPRLVIDDIVLVNYSDVDDRAIMAKIHQPTGEELDLDLLKSDLAEIYDFGVFELIDFELRWQDDSLVLVITANPKYYAPNIVNFGISYEGGEGGRSDVELRARWTRMEMNAFGAELRTDIQVGTNNLLRSEYYQPLSWARRPFVALTAKVEHDSRDWYQDLVRVAQYKELQATARPEMGLRIGHYGEIRGGIDYGYLRITDRTGDSPADFDGRRGGYLVRASFDMMDLPILPRKGYLLHANYFRGRPEFGSDLDYARLEGGAAGAVTVHRHTFSGRVTGGSNLDTEIPEFHMFTLGGLSRLSGYNRDQIRGQAYGLASVAWYHLFAGSTQPYTTAWHIGLQGEAGNAWLDPRAARLNDLRYSGLVSIVATTIIGPAAVTYAHSEGGHNSFYITVGTIRDLAH